jgi:hypothetical protein
VSDTVPNNLAGHFRFAGAGALAPIEFALGWNDAVLPRSLLSAVATRAAAPSARMAPRQRWHGGHRRAHPQDLALHQRRPTTRLGPRAWSRRRPRPQAGALSRPTGSPTPANAPGKSDPRLPTRVSTLPFNLDSRTTGTCSDARLRPGARSPRLAAPGLRPLAGQASEAGYSTTFCVSRAGVPWHASSGQCVPACPHSRGNQSSG